MKKILILAAAALLLAGCTGDDINTISVDDSDINANSSVTQETGISSGNDDDDGSGDYTLSSEDSDATDEDIVANTKFHRKISVVYSTSGSATVSGAGSGQSVTISGNDVTISNIGDEKVIYELSGTTTDGFLKLYSDRKQAIVLNGASITNKGGAAINNQGKKRCFVVVSGTNSLADQTLSSSSASYSDETSSEQMKAAFFSEGQLIFSGSGTLTVKATGKAAITSDDYVRFMSSPTVNVSSTLGHGVRGKDFIRVSNGTVSATVSGAGKKGFSSDSLVAINGGISTLTVSGGVLVEGSDYTGSAGIRADQVFEMTGGTVNITNSGQGGKGISGDGTGHVSGGTLTVKTTGAKYGSSGGGWGGWGGGSSSNSKAPKGIKFDGTFTVSGGTLDIQATNHEAIESKTSLTFSGGRIYAYSSQDDAVNASGAITFSGGYVYARSANNDAVDSNYGRSGAITITDGVVIAHGVRSPEEGLDCDNNAYIVFKGGTVFTSGGQQGGGGGGGRPGGGGSSSSSPSCSVPVLYLSSYSLSKGYFTVTDSSGNVIFAVEVPAAVSGCYSFVASPFIKSGSTYKYGVVSFAPSESTAEWGSYLYTGGTASVSTGSWTAGSGYTSK